MNDSRTVAVVLAAGQGKRLRSSLPKVLHRVGGRTLIGHVLHAVADAGIERTVAVVSAQRDAFEDALRRDHAGLSYVVQDPPAGTGDAVKQALPHLGGAGTVVVLAGDSPLITSATLRDLLELRAEQGASCALVSARVSDPRGGGRIIRGEDGSVLRIVEERDATPEEKAVDEVNASLYAFDARELVRCVNRLGSDNAQGEVYLTDVIGMLRRDGRRVVGLVAPEEETIGVNTRAHLAEVGAVLRRRVAQRWSDEGVTIVDPATTYIDASVVIEKDATVLPFTFLEGRTVVRGEASVGPQSRIVDSDIGAGAEVTFSVVRDSHIGDGASVGPFASLRPGTTLGPGGRLGTFVETKNSSLGEGSKANHLAYLGDARIGSGVNVGAGTITCNWDGKEKHETVIDDDAYIGSDTMLVAPVHIGERAATGAGSVVRDDVPADGLAVGVPARVIEGGGDRMGRADAEAEDGGR